MKQTPILMQPPLAQATAEGWKTITRRGRGLDEINAAPDGLIGDPICLDFLDQPNHWVFNCVNKVREIVCPYGAAGDLLYVREKWFFANGDVGYFGELESKPEAYLYAPGEADKLRCRSALHLKKIDSRTWLKIKSIRPERVQSISKSDAIAEGVARIRPAFGVAWAYRDYSREAEAGANFPMFLDPLDSFRTLWLKINGAPSWDANVWVWRIEYEKLPANEIPH